MYVNMFVKEVREVTACMPGAAGQSWDGGQVSVSTQWVINIDGERRFALMDTWESDWQLYLWNDCSSRLETWITLIKSFPIDDFSFHVLSSFCLCCLKISLRSSTLNWRKSPTRSSPSREQLSLMWWSTCDRIRSPTVWSTPYPRWVCTSGGP